MSTYPYTNAVVIGSTGLVGRNILSTLLDISSLRTTTISRRAPGPASASPAPSNLDAVVEPETTAWAAKLASLSPPPQAVFSALGTTRAQVGGIANQWKIDHDLNVELAKAAKAAGAKTYVFISSAGSRGMLAGHLPYTQMKMGVEKAIEELGFDNAIIVRPGLIMGEREQSRLGEVVADTLIRGLGRINAGWQDAAGQGADEIARAAVRAAQLAAEGKAPSRFWAVEAADIIRLGRTEWKESEGKTSA